ncbi:MAG: pentapeptide repeat-containing protein, partial [Pirellulaceae bacterium]
YSVDFTGADLSKCDLREADMTGAKIARADFTFAKLQGSIGTNVKPWGFTSKKEDKKSWWKVWRAAI